MSGDKFNDGGHAFPSQVGGGMSLRDWLAGQALASGMVEETASERDLEKMFGGRSNIYREEIIAAGAYRLADAMLAERRRDSK